MPPRYPLAPLAALLRITLHQPGRPVDDDRADAGLVALADRLGMSLSTMKRRHRNGLTEREADRAAVAAGVHPSAIWPTWWDGAPGDHDWYADDPTLAELAAAA
jgi:hypothetical protein